MEQDDEAAAGRSAFILKPCFERFGRAGRGCELDARIVLENTLAVDNEAACEKVATKGWGEREFDGG